MHEELALYERGEITFGEFERRTREAWMRLASGLLRHWKAGCDVSVEDLYQELLVAAWRFVPKFDPARGVSLRDFVVYNACDKAKKWLHKRRNAYRRDDKAAGRFELVFSGMSLQSQDRHEEIEDVLLNRIPIDPGQEHGLEKRAALASIDWDDLAFLHYQRAGSIEGAVLSIQSSPVARYALRAVTISETYAVLEKSLERAAELVAGAA